MIGLRVSAVALALVTGGAFVLPAQPARAQVFVDVRVGFAPPPLPIYLQPPLPGPDYIWAPGYWAWDDDFGDYYWVPGTWVLAPRPGLLWTPGYWGWDSGVYIFHAGYWGPHIGYYGGVNYGFGYTGFGFEGGYWNGPHYFYNRSVNNITNVNITNVYNKTVVVNRTTVTKVSYSGGPGGVQARPTPEQLAAQREPHVQATPAQMQHVQTAQANRSLFASANHGAPPIAATARPAQFSGPGVVRAQAAHSPAIAGGPRHPAPAGSTRMGEARMAAPAARGEAASPYTPPRPSGGAPEGYERRPASATQARPEPYGPPPAARSAPPRPQERPAPPRPAAPRSEPHPQQREEHKPER
jgi:hypothetical protein